MTTVISIEKLSKMYQLGVIGSGTFRGDMQRWWAKMRGRPDPLLKVGEADRGNRVGEMIWALKDVSFDIQQGEAVGIIGRNGAGKSTLLKILSRVTAPTSGLVKVKGRIASLLEVGTGFHPELTGRENIYLNGAILGMSRNEVRRKFDQIVDFSGIEKFIDTPVKRYSSGMYVRLAFAVAAHLEPDILIVDEILAVGDAEFQKKCLGKMESVTDEGRTVLFVSHNMRAIMEICQNVCLLSAGSLAFRGTAEAAINEYLKQSQLTAYQKWQLSNAPGDSIVKLTSVGAFDERGIAKDRFDVQESIRLQMSYEVLSDHKYRLTPNFRIFDALGNPLFFTSELTDEAGSGLKRIGRYTSTCEIPRNLLNEGILSITAVVSTIEKHIPHFYAENALNIEITDSMKPGGARNTIYSGYIPGAVRPLLKWHTEFLKEA